MAAPVRLHDPRQPPALRQQREPVVTRSVENQHLTSQKAPGSLRRRGSRGREHEETGHSPSAGMRGDATGAPVVARRYFARASHGGSAGRKSPAAEATGPIDPCRAGRRAGRARKRLKSDAAVGSDTPATAGARAGVGSTAARASAGVACAVVTARNSTVAEAQPCCRSRILVLVVSDFFGHLSESGHAQCGPEQERRRDRPPFRSGATPRLEGAASEPELLQFSASTQRRRSCRATTRPKRRSEPDSARRRSGQQCVGC